MLSNKEIQRKGHGLVWKYLLKKNKLKTTYFNNVLPLFE